MPLLAWTSREMLDWTTGPTGGDHVRFVSRPAVRSRPLRLAPSPSRHHGVMESAASPSRPLPRCFLPAPGIPPVTADRFFPSLPSNHPARRNRRPASTHCNQTSVRRILAAGVVCSCCSRLLIYATRDRIHRAPGHSPALLLGRRYLQVPIIILSSTLGEQPGCSLRHLGDCVRSSSPHAHHSFQEETMLSALEESVNE